MKHARFLFFVFLFACCLLTCPATALSEGGYQFVAKWGSETGDGQLRSPCAVAVDATGNVYVADSENHYIQKFSSSGEFIAKWGTQGSGNGKFHSPNGLAVDASGNVYVADSRNHRIQKFSSSGSFIATWGSEGTGDGQFNFPYDITVDAAENVYVTDAQNHRVQKFTSSGVFIAKWGSQGTGDEQFHSPRGIACDASGNIYVVDADNHRIQKFTSGGGLIAKWGSQGTTGNGRFNSPTGIAVDASGDVYVADNGNYRIQKFTSTGDFIAKWGSLGTGDGQFYTPTDTAIDGSGDVYVAEASNRRIQKFSSTGIFIANWHSTSGDGRLRFPRGIAVDAAGNIYVAESGNHRIQKFTSGGVFIAKWDSQGTGDGQFYIPADVAVDASGNVYVLDYGNHRIQKFTSEGAFITKWGTRGTGDGQFDFPYGIAVDAAGNVYIADYGNHRIQKFSSSGSFITKWGSQGTGDGQFNYPMDVAVDALGNVYVAERSNNRIQKFSSEGSFIAKWGSFSSEDGQFFYPAGVAVDASGCVYVTTESNYRVQKFSSSGEFMNKWGVRGSADGQFESPSGIAVDSTGSVYVVDSTHWNVQKFSPISSYAPFFPHVSANASWQTEIAVINSSNGIVTGTLKAFNDRGQLVGTKTVTLPAHGRKQSDIAAEFTRHSEIGYLIFDTHSAAVHGYAKFYREGIYRAAIPAIKEVNTSDIYIPHIAANAQWRTELSLLNTTSAAKESTIAFNNGQIRNITLNANEHTVFDIADLLGNPPRPDLESATILNSNGIIGVALFYSADGSQMDGILLTDKAASILYYPHVADDNWWTGIAAYNLSNQSSTITITPYDSQGAALVSSTLSMEGKGKYVGVVSDLGLPAETAWFRIDSSSQRPLTGFALFSPVDNQQLAAYAGGGGEGLKNGVFPKIEKDGWTGIAFVNTESADANVSLIAYDDNGAPVDARTLKVGGHAKVVELVEDLFLHDIGGATYVAYSSDGNIAGFQLNGSADGTMIDGLPALGGIH